jgi:Fe-S-cluster containining protein
MSGDAVADAAGRAAGTAAALRRLGELYADLDAELGRLATRCELSGRCCDFPRSGLTLFATDLELRWLRERTPAGRNDDPALCPHWQAGRCEARDGRPLGCRLYFCDAAKAAELDDLSVRFHARLKRIHDETGVPYRYGPFLPRVRAPSR